MIYSELYHFFGSKCESTVYFERGILTHDSPYEIVTPPPHDPPLEA